MDAQNGFQLGQLRGILERRAMLIATVAGAFLLAAVFVAAIMPDEYSSRATLLIEPQTISETLVESNLQESDLNSRLHLIQMQILSRGRLSRVIDELDVYPEMSEQVTREEVIAYMREQIGVAPVLPELEAAAGIRNRNVEINTFVLAFRHRKAEMAAAVANRLANDFIEEHIRERVQTSGDTSEFIETELQRLQRRISDVESRIAAIKSDNAGRLPEDLDANQRLYDRALQAQRTLLRDLAIAESDEAFYRQQMLTGDAEFFKYSNNELTPERRLEALKLALGEFKSRGFTDKHPDVIRARAEMAEVEERVANAKPTEEGGDGNLTIAQQNAQAEAQRAALRAQSSRSELANVESQITDMEQRLAQTPRVAEQLGNLEREHEHLFESIQEFAGKRLEAGVAADMERRQKGERFRVLEAAIPEPNPASPNRPVIVVAGLMLGLLLGGGLAILIEAADSSYHDTRSLQDRVRIPVLASVPDVVLESDRAAKRRRRFRQLLAAGVVTGGVLVAAIAGNWWVNGVPGAISGLVGGGSEAAAPAAPSGGR